MATNIGPKIGIQGDAEYNKALQNIIQRTKTLASEMEAVTAAFDDEASAQERSKKSGEVLSRQMEAQKALVDKLREGVEKSAAKYGENATETLKLKAALNKAEAQESTLEKQQKDLNKSVEDGTDAVEDSTDKWDKFKDIMGTIGKAAAAAAVAIGAMAYKLGKEVVDSYSELEQNLGGSKAVFGDFADSIQKTSEQAYKSMGTSQSDYLATANKIGALFQGSGLTQQRSLELTTSAMQRAADMASVMGIDTETALNAITGAAKGNYTMMDNIGVAMNATTLQAYALSQGIDTAWSSMSNAEKAEVAMQYFFENTQQYAGNFEKEAVGTISGSIGSLMASIDTFVAGLGDSNADIEGMTANIVECFKNVITNIEPVLQNLIKAAPDAIGVMIEAIGAMLPDLLQTATDLFEAVLQMLISVLPELIPVAVDAVLQIVNTIIDNLPMIINAAIQIILTLVKGIGEALPDLIPAIVDCIVTIADTLTKPDMIAMIIDAAVTIIGGLIEGILKALPVLISNVPYIIMEFVKAIAANLPKIFDSGRSIMDSIVTGFLNSIPRIINGIGEMITKVKNKMKSDLIDKTAQWGKDMITGFINGIKSSIGSVTNAVKSIANTVSSWLHFSRPDVGPLRSYESWMPDMIDGMVRGIRNSQSKLDAAMYDMTMGMTGSAGVGSVRGGSVTNMGGVTINVNAAPGQSESAIADAVMEKMQRIYEGRTTVWA